MDKIEKRIKEWAERKQIPNKNIAISFILIVLAWYVGEFVLR
jgi:hypothetical protein